MADPDRQAADAFDEAIGTPPPVVFAPSVESEPVTGEFGVCFGTRSDALYCLSHDGHLRWIGGSGRGTPVPHLAGGLVLFRSTRRTITAPYNHRPGCDNGPAEVEASRSAQEPWPHHRGRGLRSCSQ